jgi:hypothetical protein
MTKVTLQRTDLRGISWLLIMELSLQSNITWNEVLYDSSEEQGDNAQP